MVVNNLSILSVKDCARILQINEFVIRRYIKNGKLKAYKLGGGNLWRVYASDLDEFIRAEGKISN